MVQKMTYFSDRELGPAPRINDELPDAAWRGLVALFNRSLDGNLFAEAFPDQCPDGYGISGTSRSNLVDTMVSHIPSLDGWPNAAANPGVVAAMDLLEFGWRYAASPSSHSHHSYYRHDHLEFDKVAGRSEWFVEVNLILRRNGVSMELGEDGHVTRIGPPSATLVLKRPLPPSGDSDVDRLLAKAVRKYKDPDLSVRRESLEHLWDALERIKTVLNPDKKAGVSSLIQEMGKRQMSSDVFDSEFTTLTRLGNSFRIRHHETTTEAVPEHMVDYLFVRAYALLVEAVVSLAGQS